MRTIRKNFRFYFLTAVTFAWLIWVGALLGWWGLLMIPAALWVTPAHWKRPAPAEATDDDNDENEDEDDKFDDSLLPLDIAMLVAQFHGVPPPVRPMVLAALWQRMYGEESFDSTRPVKDLYQEVEVGLAAYRSPDA